MILMILILLVFVFFMMRLLPGDAAIALAGQTATDAQIAERIKRLSESLTPDI